MTKSTLVLVSYIVILLGSRVCFSANTCTPLPDRPDSQSKYRAMQFPKLLELNSIQQKLLIPYLALHQISFEQWLSDSDGHAAAFFALTKAHENTELILSKNKSISSLEMFLELREIHGDRIIVQMNSLLFNAWKSNGGQFIIHRADGSFENGKVNFNSGNAGGSLHCGYDFQGYTSVTKVPRLQWNYNSAEALVDLDIDGYAPWIGGFIPNPKHMTWENSDVRNWFSDFQNKFGNPGFVIIPR